MRANGGGADMTTTSGASEAEDNGPQHETADLVEALKGAKRGRVSPQDIFHAFMRSRLFCERPQNPGFLAVKPPEPDGTPRRSRILDLAAVSEADPAPTRLVPVFTSLDQFEQFAGGGAWFSTTGADLLDLLPPELDVWLDPAAEHTVRLSTAATAVEPVLHISYGLRGSAA
ncbi:SseB family protein [Streptomyces sp. NPDC055952]|uniref:SseB family protein n=1 Tax=Streptomyces sp. NPDC055952 TaxID=3345663 RepID=UPI0035D79E08